MTLTFIPKLIVTVVMLLVFGGWMLTVLKQFALSALTQAASF
jgi:flagellar biosynthetic protein FliQ